MRVVPPIKLVIDLTRSSRYYDPQNWLDRGVKYVKVRQGGEDVTGAGLGQDGVAVEPRCWSRGGTDMPAALA